MEFNKVSIAAAIYVFSCLLLCSTKADEVIKVPVSKYQPGRVSYFDMWMQLSDNVNSHQSFNADHLKKEQVKNVISDLTALTNVLHVHKSSSPKLKNLLSDEYSAWLKSLRDVVFKNPNPRLSQSQCINDTGRMVVGLFNGSQHWATQMLDSIGKPGPSLTLGRLKWVGNYDQCRSVVVPPNPAMGSKGFTGNYVWIILYIQQFQMYWGTCFPSTCEDWQIYLLANDTKTALHMKPDVNVGFPSIVTNNREFTTATNISIVILCVIGALMVLGTVYDLYFVQKPMRDAKKHRSMPVGKAGFPASNIAPEKHTTNGAVQNGHSVPGSVTDEAAPLLNKPREAAELGPLAKALVAFSIYTNATKFLNTKQAPGSLSSIHGIRFLSMSWVILGHIYFFGMNYVVNLDEQPAYLKRWTFTAVSNAFPSVDSFFTLSGLLTAYLAVKEIKKRGLKINWGLFYFHRFWRLTPPYMLTLLLVLGLQRFLGSGSLWGDTQPADKSNCEDYWWTNLLYVNNVVKVDKMCFGHSWYLANDMQFFILSPLMLIPFYFKVSAGLASCLLFLLVHWIITGVKSTIGDWPLAPMGIGPEFRTAADYSKHYYFAPYTRIGPYIIGLAVGGLLATKSIRLSRMTNLIGWTVATAAGLAVVYGAYSDISGESESSVSTRAFYNTVSRSVWGACVCWVIVSCTYGYGGLVNSILSWSPFVSLGRLTYMAYLIHPCILNVYYGNMDQLFYANNLNIIISYLGILVLVNMVAFVLMLGLESPMIGLEKALLPRPKD